MEMNEVVTKLNVLFDRHYSKLIADMNSNCFSATVGDKGIMEAPVIKLSSGGGTQLLSKTTENGGQLNPAAVVSVEMGRTHSVLAIYRVKFPYLEMVIAANNEAYFKQLMGIIMPKVVANYELTWGSRELSRFGTFFTTKGFKEDAGDSFYLELRFTGQWSTGEEVV